MINMPHFYLYFLPDTESRVKVFRFRLYTGIYILWKIPCSGGGGVKCPLGKKFKMVTGEIMKKGKEKRMKITLKNGRKGL